MKRYIYHLAKDMGRYFGVEPEYIFKLLDIVVALSNSECDAAFCDMEMLSNELSQASIFRLCEVIAQTDSAHLIYFEKDVEWMTEAELVSWAESVGKSLPKVKDLAAVIADCSNQVNCGCTIPSICEDMASKFTNMYTVKFEQVTHN